MIKVDIVLIVDHKWRDLPGIAALAVWLEDKFGLRAKLVPYALWQNSLLRYRPQLLAVSNLNGQRGELIARCARQMGIRLVVIMTEGRVNNFQGMDYLVGKKSGARHADLWFTWSATVRDFMLEQEVLPSNKIVVGGANRFDIYRNPLKKLIIDRDIFIRKYELDAKRPIVSWATNFTHAKFHLKNQDFLIKDWLDLGLSRYAAYSNPLEVARLDWETRDKSFVLMQKLLEARPELQLAVKPHPAEDHEYYQQFVQECRKKFGPRVVLIGFEYIWDLLNIASVHIHRLCTTGVEAWFLNVPSIDLHLTDYLPWSTQLPGAASEAVQGNDLVQNLDSLIERIDYYLRGGQPSPEQYRARENYIQRWLYKVDGLRCPEYAQVIASLMQEKRKIKFPDFSRSNIPIFTKGLVTQFLGPNAGTKLRIRGSRIRNNKIDRIGQIDKNISPQDTCNWIKNIRQVLQPFVWQDASMNLKSKAMQEISS